MLRRKNRLMRAGRVEKAGALAKCIGKVMKRCSQGRLGRIGGKSDAKEMWAAVRKITGRKQNAPTVDGVTAESLNVHYAAISTDHKRHTARRRPSVRNLTMSLSGISLKRLTVSAQQPQVLMVSQLGSSVLEHQYSLSQLPSSLISLLQPPQSLTSGSMPSFGLYLRPLHLRNALIFVPSQSHQFLRELWSALWFRVFFTQLSCRHHHHLSLSLINLLSDPQAPRQLPSSTFYTQSPISF